jgi:hypothetical protein
VLLLLLASTLLVKEFEDSGMSGREKLFTDSAT